MRALVVVLNKNNAEGLRAALESLVRQSGVDVCVDYDVLVVDGWSADASEEVVKGFSSRFGCVEFVRQRFPGGVGQARVEAVRRALDLGYDVVVWGDSENVYDEDYLREILGCINPASGCDVCSGSTYVRQGFWGGFFYWYHTYHHLFKMVSRRHAPGNNKAVKAALYRTNIYPAISRSDDFFFSLAVRGNAEFCHCSGARLTTSLPDSLKGVIAWQRSRVRGLVEGALLKGWGLPPDFLPWFLFMASPPLLTLTHILRLLGIDTFLQPVVWFLTAAFTAGAVYMMVRLELLARERYLGYRPMQGFLGFVGMYLHSIFTTYYTLKYTITLRRRVSELREFNRAVRSYFRFP
ncbi:MAG: glycosyltransferase family A protein [Zestosphaera sp.]